jgi:hypothetical protein
MICHAQNPETCELLWSAGDADAFIRPGQSVVTRPVTRTRNWVVMLMIIGNCKADRARGQCLVTSARENARR